MKDVKFENWDDLWKNKGSDLERCLQKKIKTIVLLFTSFLKKIISFNDPYLM